MRLVVTGSEGLLGRATVELARQRGASVMACDRSIPPDPSDAYLQADVRDLGHVLEVMSGADAVVHLAALRDDGMTTPSETFRSNVTATHNVLMAARTLGVQKVVLASSIRVVVPLHPNGWPGYRYLPFDEDHPPFLQGEYARSKYVGEVLADSMAAEFGLDVISLRYAPIVDATRAHLPALASRDNLHGPHYIDVTDAATCTWLAATAPRLSGRHQRCFVTAADTRLGVPSREFALEHYPEAEWRGEANGSFCSLVDGSRAAEFLGFEPSVSWRDHASASQAPRPRRWRRQSS